MDDVRAVMDAAGWERAAVMGVSEGGAVAILFAATSPDRVWALVLAGAYARTLRAPDYSFSIREHEFERALAEKTQRWGIHEHSLEVARAVAPSGTDKEWQALAKMIRHGARPGAMRDLERMGTCLWATRGAGRPRGGVPHRRLA
jgi:pimeloyl-ACP methyl ester carboxylesterase